MFYVLWLPLGVFVVFVIIAVTKALKKNSWKRFFEWAGIGLAAAAVMLMFGAMTVSVFRDLYPADSVADTDHPTQLISVAGDNGLTGRFYLLSGYIDSVDQYRYRYYLPGTNKIATDSVPQSRALLIEDSPEKPYFVYIYRACPPRSYFWITKGCSWYIPYIIEFHVPPGSVIESTQINP